MTLEDLFKLFDKNYILDDIIIDEIILNKRKIEKNRYAWYSDYAIKRYLDYTIKRIEFNDENSCSIYIYKKGVKNMTDLEKTKTMLEALYLNYKVVKKEKEIELQVYTELWNYINDLYFNHDESLKERGE